MRSVTTALAMWMVAAATGAAYASSQTPPSSEGASVTMTGCLRAGEQPGIFLLMNATAPGKPEGKDAAGRHAGETAATPPPRRPETLRLAAATTRLKLDEHVGHTVSVTGMLAPEDRIVTPGIVLPDPPAGGEKTNRKPEVGGKPPARVFNVRTVTHVAAECK